MPEPDPAATAGESADPAQVAAAAVNPRLGRVEIELPDGRYLFAYRRLLVGTDVNDTRPETTAEELRRADASTPWSKT